MQVKKHQLEPYIEQLTGSKLGKGYVKTVYCHLVYLTYMQSYCCSVAQSCLTLCDPMDFSMPGLPVPHHLLKIAQVHVHCFSDAIQPSCPLLPSSPSAFNLSQHQGIYIHTPTLKLNHHEGRYLVCPVGLLFPGPQSRVRCTVG